MNKNSTAVVITQPLPMFLALSFFSPLAVVLFPGPEQCLDTGVGLYFASKIEIAFSAG